MRIFKDKYVDKKTGEKRKSQRYTIDFSDHNGFRHRVAGLTAKRQTQTLADNIEALISCKISGQRPDPELQRWLEGVTSGLLTKFASWGLIDSQRVGHTKLLKLHLGEYEAELKAKGKSQIHVQKTISRCKAIFKGCRFSYLRDIDPSAVIRHLARMRDEDKSAASTRNHFLTAIKCFCNWAVRNGRLSINPLRHVSKEKAEAKQRGILLPEQFQKLITDTFSKNIDRLRIPAVERCLLYALVGATGLRKKEIVALKWEHLKLDESQSCVILPGTKTKNKETARQPLPPQVSGLFAKYKEQGGITDDMKVFPNVKYRINTAELVRQDLKAAELKNIDFEGREIDFHSLRNSFISFLANSDTPFKAVQTLARHSDPKLTYNVYARTFEGTERKAVAGLPVVDLSSFAAMGAMSASTELADNHSATYSAICLPQNGNQPDLTGFMGGVSKEVESASNAQETAFSGVSGGIPEVGLEPTPCCQDGILNPARLPIPPLRHKGSSNNCF